MAFRAGEDGAPPLRVTDDNVIQPFRLEESGLRGRMVRLGSVLDEIMMRHNYPFPVSYLLAETVTLCALLAAMLKYKGVFTLQTKTSGPVRTLVADVTSDGDVRAYAGFDEEALQQRLEPEQPESDLGQAAGPETGPETGQSAAAAGLFSREGYDMPNYLALLGDGYISFTVDQGEHMHRYQGIVELKGPSLTDCVQHYFTQSEQILTALKIAVREQGGRWRAGAIMVQKIPDEGGADSGKARVEPRKAGDDWARTGMLLFTVTEEEMLSPNLHSADVLFRLFHEDGVRVYDQLGLQHKCRCSRERVAFVLSSLPRREIEDTRNDEGNVLIKCEFCSREYSFNESDLEEVYENVQKAP